MAGFLYIGFYSTPSAQFFREALTSRKLGQASTSYPAWGFCRVEGSGFRTECLGRNRVFDEVIEKNRI